MDFRNYEKSNNDVKELYKNQRINQTLSYVQRSIRKYVNLLEKINFGIYLKISLKI